MNEHPNGLHLQLPFPDPILMPNRKPHWAVKRIAANYARDAGYYLAYNQHITLDPEKRYQANLVFCPPDRRHRDLDNLVAAMKSALDGMCRALGIDDKVLRPVPDWGPVVEGGKVEVMITEISGQQSADLTNGLK